MSRGILFATVALPGCLILSIASALAQSSGEGPAAAVSREVKQSAAAGAGNAGQAATAEASVSPGPGEEQRKALLNRIMEAKEKGIGIANYMMAFKALDQSVKSGSSSADILKRVDSLNLSIEDQLKRSAILKVQKPTPPVGGLSSPSSSGATATAGGSDSEMIKQLKAKYGDQIPADMKDKLPQDLGSDPSKLMDMLKNLKK